MRIARRASSYPWPETSHPVWQALHLLIERRAQGSSRRLPTHCTTTHREYTWRWHASNTLGRGHDRAQRGQPPPRMGGQSIRTHRAGCTTTTRRRDGRRGRSPRSFRASTRSRSLRRKRRGRSSRRPMEGCTTTMFRPRQRRGRCPKSSSVPVRRAQLSKWHPMSRSKGSLLRMRPLATRRARRGST